MVRSLMASGEFAVMINAVIDGFESRLAMRSQLSFMEAGDYAIEAQGYFTFAILTQPEWSSVNIEIGDRNGSIQIIEITR